MRSLLFLVAALFALVSSAQLVPELGFDTNFLRHTIQSREETVGKSCSPEGQWNCMRNSWQRCASGRWSEEIDCAKGTVCSPLGITDVFRVEHDGSVSGGSRGGTSGAGSMRRISVARLKTGVAILLWCVFLA